MENILKFYVTGQGAKVLRRNGAKTKYGFINAFAEILVIAQEFERNPLELDFNIGSTKSGAVISKTKRPKERTKYLVILVSNTAVHGNSCLTLPLSRRNCLLVLQVKSIRYLFMRFLITRLSKIE